MMIELVPWSETDLWVVERCLSDAEMMRHLGGPQSQEQIVDAHSRYLGAGASGSGGMFTVVQRANSEIVGNIGYWAKSWRDEPVYETGWMIFPEHQGRGLATQALALLIARVRREHGRRFLHAFPAVENVASNALCRKAGFTNLGDVEFEYPPGHQLRCNDWSLDLWSTPDEPGVRSG